MWQSGYHPSFLLLGNDPGCVGPSGVNAMSIAYCPAGYEATGVGYLASTFCGYSSADGVAGMYSLGGRAFVWPVNAYQYTLRAYANCVKS